jgi:hypothetical protein
MAKYEVGDFVQNTKGTILEILEIGSFDYKVRYSGGVITDLDTSYVDEVYDTIYTNQELIDRVEKAKSINGFQENIIIEHKGRYGEHIFSVGDIVAYDTSKSYIIESVYNDDEKCDTYYTFSDTGGLRNWNGNGLILVKSVADVKVAASKTQVAGNHYSKLKIQPMEYCLQNDLNYGQSNAIKYITRYKDKNGIEDLKKAIHCIELLIEFEEKDID